MKMDKMLIMKSKEYLKTIENINIQKENYC